MNITDFQLELNSRTNPTIVGFWAPWCGQCRIKKPVLEKLANQYTDRVGFWAINADEHPDLLRAFKILGIPTVLITRNGKVIGRYTGIQSEQQYRVTFEMLANRAEIRERTLPQFERFLRITAGTALAMTGIFTQAWGLTHAGGILAFLGMYDRCPIWRAITGWIKERQKAS